MPGYPGLLMVAATFSFGIILSPSEHVLRAQEADKPAIAPQPRTINLTQEQRFIVKENVKDLKLSKARKDSPETIGDPVPPGVDLHPLPPEVATKVSQARSHSFYIKEGSNAVVLVSPNDRRVADVIH